MLLIGNAVSKFCFDTGKLSLTSVENDTWVNFLFYESNVINIPVSLCEYPCKEGTVRVCIDKSMWYWMSVWLWILKSIFF